MDPDADAFRALARSSPWRWRTMHLRRQGDGEGEVEAWIRRPDWMLVRSSDGSQYVQRAGGRTLQKVSFEIDRSVSVQPIGMVPGGSLTPTYRPDGLVSERPTTGGPVDYDDPMHRSYRWIAMLDPVELAVGVELSEVRVLDRAGRPTWSARAVPVGGYDPRCACCPLLWSEISDELEYGADRVRPAADYPRAYDVALDFQTGIVVDLRAVDGPANLDFAVEILEVDADLAELVARHGDTSKLSR